jgi:hypothetical protein
MLKADERQNNEPKDSSHKASHKPYSQAATQ